MELLKDGWKINYNKPIEYQIYCSEHILNLAINPY